MVKDRKMLDKFIALSLVLTILSGFFLAAALLIEVSDNIKHIELILGILLYFISVHIVLLDLDNVIDYIVPPIWIVLLPSMLIYPLIVNMSVYSQFAVSNVVSFISISIYLLGAKCRKIKSE